MNLRILPLLFLIGCQAPVATEHQRHHRADTVAAPSVTTAPEITPQATGKGTTAQTALGKPTPATPITDPDDDFLIEYDQYTVSYNRHRAGPNWAAWRITKENFGGTDRQARFSPDTKHLPQGWLLVQHDDYKDSGFDRGHMVRSKDRTNSTHANEMTFLTTNILPQKHDLNGGPWKGLEDACDVLARHDGRWVFVMAGGLYSASPQTLGKAHVAIPDAFWKVAVVLPPGASAADVTANTPVMAAVMPNREGISHEKWATYRTTLGDVERRAGWSLLGEVAPAIRASLETRTQ